MNTSALASTRPRRDRKHPYPKTEVAELFDVSERTVRRWIADGFLDACPLGLVHGRRVTTGVTAASVLRAWTELHG